MFVHNSFKRSTVVRLSFKAPFYLSLTKRLSFPKFFSNHLKANQAMDEVARQI